jgi:hypothetical protein
MDKIHDAQPQTGPLRSTQARALISECKRVPFPATVIGVVSVHVLMPLTARVPRRPG